MRGCNHSYVTSYVAELVNLGISAHFVPRKAIFNASPIAFNFGAKKKGRIRRKEELSGFHLRPSMYLSAENKGNRRRVEV